MIKRFSSKHSKLIRQFSNHVKVAIVGGGTAGVAVSSQLCSSPNFSANDITVFEPRNEHNYQPSYTMIAGGVLGTNPNRIKDRAGTYIKKSMDSVFTSGVNLVKDRVMTFDPDNNTLITKQGEYTYDFLVVTPGCSVRFDQIDGLSEALDDYDHPVVSIYREDYAYKTLRHREKFQEGKAIFTQPTMPIKCGGAPQKILYLSESRWREQGLRDNIDVDYYTAAGVMFPPCPKYSDALDKVRESKDIPVHYFHNLTAIDKDSQIATFKNVSIEENVSVPYDFLHVVPAQTSRKFIAESVLAGDSGFVEVDQHTMQHKRYPNVFS